MKRWVDVIATWLPAHTGGPLAIGGDMFRIGFLLALVFVFMASACGGNASRVDGSNLAAHAITFTGAGTHVFVAEWLVIQPNVSGSVDSQTEVAYAPATWATHPRALEAQSLSLCGSSLNEDESIRNMEAAGFPQPAAQANIRSIRVSESSRDRLPVPFCAGVHHVDQTWTFLHDAVLPTADPALGEASGTASMIEDHVDLIAVLFDGDVLVTGLDYETSP
jgi:hypothetical protein